MKCAIQQCNRDRFVNGEPKPFCLEHHEEYVRAPEGQRRRPTSASDFRDRLWKENRNEIANAKWEAATVEQREEWRKGGNGR